MASTTYCRWILFDGCALGFCRQAARPLDEGGDPVDTDTAANIGEGVGAFAPHALRVGFHDAEIGADERREINLVHDEMWRDGKVPSHPTTDPFDPATLD